MCACESVQGVMLLSISLPAFFFLSFFFLIELSLVHSVVPISVVQQSDSVYTHRQYFFIFFSIMVYHRILNIVPCIIL